MTRLNNALCIIAIVLLWLVSAYPDSLNANGTAAVPRISVDDAKNLLGQPDVVIIDVRTNKQWWRSTRKILSAVREDPSKVSQWHEKYSESQILIFYCS